MLTNIKNILKLQFGKGVLNNLSSFLYKQSGVHVFLIDSFFRNNKLISKLPVNKDDIVFFINAEIELTTNYVDEILEFILENQKEKPNTIIGIGGGTTLDAAKAIANLYNNKGKAEEYQGWDLVKNPGVYKIGIPTLSGTGAESSRTCVMINAKSKLKLGMNSDFTIFDRLILDPDLTKTVPQNQYFYTGIDTYMHSIESLRGSHRNLISDAFSEQAVKYCEQIFLSDDMMTDENREKLMVASYLGGSAIANSFVGVIHPFSAGLSVVFGIHHGEANCITMNAMEEFYPVEYQKFKEMVSKQNIQIKTGICKNLNNEQYQALYDSTIIHEKPLINALGENFKEILSFEKVKSIFQKM